MPGCSGGYLFFEQTLSTINSSESTLADIQWASCWIEDVEAWHKICRSHRQFIFDRLVDVVFYYN
jgi:hypothetical protein